MVIIEKAMLRQVLYFLGPQQHQKRENISQVIMAIPNPDKL